MNTTLTFRKERRGKDTYGLLFVKLGEPSPSSVGFSLFFPARRKNAFGPSFFQKFKKEKGNKGKGGKKNKGEKIIQREREKRKGKSRKPRPHWSLCFSLFLFSSSSFFCFFFLSSFSSVTKNKQRKRNTSFLDWNLSADSSSV